MSQEQQNNQNSDNQQNTNGTGSDNAGGNSNNDQDGTGDGEDKGDKTDKTTQEALIPSWRLKEEADKRRIAETELAKYKEQERIEREKDLRQKGKYEELLKEKEDKLTTLSSVNEQKEILEKAVESIVNQELESVKTLLGEEKFNKILGLVGYENLDVLGKSNALPKIKELVKELSPEDKNKGGQGIRPKDGVDLKQVAKEGGFNSLLGAIVGSN